MERGVRWHSQYTLPPAAARVAEKLLLPQNQREKDRESGQAGSDGVGVGGLSAKAGSGEAGRRPSDEEATSTNPTQTFFAWLEKVEEQRGNEQERLVMEYLDLLKSYKDRSQTMKAEISAALQDLEQLRELHTAVSSKTSEIHLACEQLLQDERGLVQGCDAVSSRLQYFKDYDRFRKLINSPTLSVMSDQFVAILSRLDECIQFLSQHQEYQDAQMYVTRFQHLRNKGLALAHTRITSAIRSLMQPGKGGAPEHAIRSDDRSVAQIRALMDQLERRRGNGEEYANLLQACYNFYFEQRHNIRSNSITHMIETNVKENQANLPRLVRNGCLFMKTLCEEERTMYNRFFTVVNEGFNNMIDGMTRRFYEAVRPLILQRAVSLDGLIQLCSVINLEVLEDHEVMGPFASVSEELLADVQERLVHRAQTFVDTSVRRYTPTKPDVDYPDRLKLNTSGEATVAWYPPITRALNLLSQLYRSLERSVCEGIAQEILDAGLISLDTGARIIRRNKDDFHADLFLIKHLLVLREQIAPFDFAFTVTEVGLDFSSIRDAAVRLLSQTNTLFRFDASNALYSFLVKGAPAVTKDRLDARKEIDTRLRDVCRRFIEHEVQAMVGPIKTLVSQVEKMNEDRRKRLPTLAPSSPAKLQSMHRTCHSAVEKEAKKLQTFLPMYLQSSDTETILFKPMKNGVLEAYRMVQDLLQRHYTAEQRREIAWPSLDAVNAALVLQQQPQRQQQEQGQGQAEPQAHNEESEERTQKANADADAVEGADGAIDAANTTPTQQLQNIKDGGPAAAPATVDNMSS